MHRLRAPLPDAARPAGRVGSRAALARLVVGLAVASLAGLAVPAAQAHPFGPPPRAWLHLDSDAVIIHWQATYDDHLALGEHLGYFEPGTMEAYLEPDVQVAPPRADEEALAASPDLHDYVLEHVEVQQDGRRCEPEVRSTELFEDGGAVTRHRCPRPEAELLVRITMLHDINPAYRTFGMADGDPPEPFAVFTYDDPEHRVAVGELAGGGSGSRLPLLAALAAVAVAGAAGFRTLTGGERS